MCNLAAEPGPCKSSVQRFFFFDSKDGTCKTFAYGGCQGNDNRFATRKECESTCLVGRDPPAVHAASASGSGSGSQTSDTNSSGSAAANSTSTPARHETDVCQLPPAEAGRCRANFPSFSFTPLSGQCESFVYGGCGGNENRFESLEACQLACGRHDAQKRPAAATTAGSGSGSGSPRPPAPGPRLLEEAAPSFLSSNRDCNVLKASGPCRAFMPSHFYNTESGQCESFVYGGCRGTANRFKSKAHCEQQCKAASFAATKAAGGAVISRSRVLNAANCLQPRLTERCLHRTPSWFFDGGSRSCRLFLYGGCGVNGNGFGTLGECERMCVPTSIARPLLRRSYSSILQYLLLQLFGGWF